MMTPDPFAPPWRFLWWDEDGERDRRRENPRGVVEAETARGAELEDLAECATSDERWRPWGERWLAGEEHET